jgi:hypothetical protein
MNPIIDDFLWALKKSRKRTLIKLVASSVFNDVFHNHMMKTFFILIIMDKSKNVLLSQKASGNLFIMLALTI